MNRTIDIDPLKSVVIDEKDATSLDSLPLNQTLECNTLSNTTIATLGNTTEIIEDIQTQGQTGEAEPAREIIRQDVETEGHELTLTVEIKNETSSTLILGKQKLGRGKWALEPPQKINPLETVQFTATSSRLRGLFARVRGDIQYSMVAEKYGANPLVVVNFESAATKRFRFDCHVPKNIGLSIKNNSSDSAVTEFETHKTITILIEDKLTISGIEEVPAKLIQKLRGRTYFDSRELIELFKTFKKAALENNELTPETFFTLFPDMQDEHVKLSMFHAFDAMQQPTGTVSFEKFARALSVISRGSTSEKALVAFLMFDLEREGAIDATNVRKVAKEASRLLKLDEWETDVDAPVAALWHRSLAKSVAVPSGNTEKSTIHEEVLPDKSAVKFEIPSSPAVHTTTPDTVTVPTQSIKFTKKKRIHEDAEHPEGEDTKKGRNFLRWSMPNKKNIFKSFVRKKAPKQVEQAQPPQEDEPTTIRRMYYNQMQKQTRANIFQDKKNQKYYREWSSDENDTDNDMSNDTDDNSDLSDDENNAHPVKHKKSRKTKRHSEKHHKRQPKVEEDEKEQDEEEPTEEENQLNEAIDDEESFSESLSEAQRKEITRPQQQGHMSPTPSMTPMGTLQTLTAQAINLKSAVDFEADELATPRERLKVEEPKALNIAASSAIPNDATSDSEADSHPSEGNDVESTEEASGGESAEEMLPSMGTTLTLRQFMRRATDVYELYSCASLFDYIHSKVVDPIESHVNKKLLRPEIEGWLKKIHPNRIKCMPEKGSQNKRYFVVRGGFLAYFRNKGDKHPIYCVSLSTATVRKSSFGKELFVKAFQLNRRLKASSRQERDKWVEIIRANIRGVNRFRSFAPLRKNVEGQWFVNGSEYFKTVYHVIQRAKKRIMIADWYFSPGLYLIRTQPLDKKYRLDNLLLEKARQGVKIYILIWRNPAVGGMSLESQYVTKYMNGLHKRISAIQHPFITPLLWTHHQKFVVVDEETAFVGGVDLCFGRYEDSTYTLTDPDGALYPGRDYMHINMFGENNGPTKECLLDRTKQHRMPWHDIHMAVSGIAARDVAFNFIERWNISMSTMPPHVKNSYVGKRLRYMVPLSEKEKGNQLLSQLEHSNFYSQLNCQVVRSVSNWSCGVPQESSIYKAYLTYIRSAKHFIYIENQFFISSIDQSTPKNKIAQQLYARVRRAIINKEKFRLIVVLPVYPSGDIQAEATQYILKYTYRTISRGRNSILGRLKKEFPADVVSQYISFNCLRNHGLLGDKPVTEQIYVHAKMMIVDDRVCIIGSANINDRSMRGTRDSEIAVVIEQNAGHREMTIDGRRHKVSAFIQDLRVRLWRDYLALTTDADELLKNPCNDECFKLWVETSHNNTISYLKIWPVMHDNLLTVEQVAELNKAKKEDYDAHASEIKGFLVDLPMKFFKYQNLNIKPLAVEKIVPKIVFL